MKRLKTLQEEQIEQERLREMLILLEQLFQREEATAKGIVGCLFLVYKINNKASNCPEIVSSSIIGRCCRLAWSRLFFRIIMLNNGLFLESRSINKS